MCTPDVKEALAEGSESFKDKAIRDEHQKKYSALVTDANESNLSGKAMEQFEGGMRNVDSMGRVVGDEAGRWGDAAASLMGMGKSEKQDAVSDTVSANYSKSSSEKSSKTKSKAKKEGGEGTGGSKSQFYAKK